MTQLAADAGSALELLRQAAAAGTLPDLALIDQHMPEMDGMELCRVIAADAALDRLRVIMLASPASSRSGPCDRAAAHLNKPVRQGELIDRVAAVLNVRPVDAMRQAPDRSTSANPTPAAATRILVAEDNPVNQKVAAAMLKRLGYSVDVVNNGREALEALERAPYAAVLMDCQMPELSGYEASLEIRRREGAAGQVPIVALTASRSRATGIAAWRQGWMPTSPSRSPWTNWVPLSSG